MPPCPSDYRKDHKAETAEKSSKEIVSRRGSISAWGPIRRFLSPKSGGRSSEEGERHSVGGDFPPRWIHSRGRRSDFTNEREPRNCPLHGSIFWIFENKPSLFYL